MPGLLIKDLPARLHLRLKARASANGRSLSREVIFLLAEALEDRAGPPSLAEVDRLRMQGKRPLTQDLLDEARSSGHP